MPSGHNEKFPEPWDSIWELIRSEEGALSNFLREKSEGF